MEPARCVRITDSELEEFLYRFCGGSVYAFEDSVRRGYITRYGIRAGLFGKAASQNGEMTGFTQITGVNLRLPPVSYTHLNAASDAAFSSSGASDSPAAAFSMRYSSNSL